MMILAVTNTTIVLLLLVLVAGGVFTWLLRRRRRDAWSEFARRSGLQFDSADSQPRVSGQLEGRDVELAVISDGSDTGELGVEVVRMSVTLLNAVPTGLTLESADDMVAEAQRLIDAELLQTGDGLFDRSVAAHAQDAQAAKEWLTTERRSAFRKLVQHRTTGSVQLEGTQLSWICREAVSSEEILSGHLKLLLRAASVIDSD